MYLYVPVLAVHAENLGASAGLVGVVVGSYGFAQLLLRIPVGVLSDRVGRRKPFILLGIVATGVGALGLGLSSEPGWLVVWRCVSGAGAAAWVAFTVLFSSYFAPEKATRAMSEVSFVGGMALILATYAGGLIAQAWGWTVPFFVAVAFSILGISAALRLEERPVPVRRSLAPRELLRIGTVPLLVTVSGVTMLSTWAQWSTVNGFSLIYAARLGADRAELGLLTTVTQAAHTAGTLLSAYMADRIGIRGTIVLALIVQASGTFVVPWLDSVGLVAVSQALGGGGRGLSYPLLMGLSIRSVALADRATAMGVFQAVYALGMFAGPTTSGLIGDAFGLPAVFVAAGIVVLVGIPVVVTRVPSN